MPTWKAYAKKDDITATKLDDFAAPDDNTDLNASATAHGLCPKLSNVATEYLSGTGVFSVPAGGGPTIARNTVDQTITSTALVNVTNLLFAVAANEVWEFTLALKAVRVAAQVTDLVYAFSIPTGGSLLKRTVWSGTTGTNDTTDGTTSVTVSSYSTVQYLMIKYLYVGGANAGNVQLQAAQSAALSGIIIKANSFIVAHKL